MKRWYNWPRERPLYGASYGIYRVWWPDAAKAADYAEMRPDLRRGVEPRDAGLRRRQEARKRRSSPGSFPL